MENNTIHTLMEELSFFKERFINRKLYLYNKLGAVQKELSNIDKILEFKNFTEEELIDMTKKRKELLLLRRSIKEELKYFEEIDKDNQFTYNTLGFYIKMYRNAKQTIEDIAVNSANFYSSNPETIKKIDITGYSEEQIQKEVESLKKVFQKVFIDREERFIKAYNKCRVI